MKNINMFSEIFHQPISVSERETMEFINQFETALFSRQEDTLFAPFLHVFLLDFAVPLHEIVPNGFRPRI